jgi:hypothetical protein
VTAWAGAASRPQRLPQAGTPAPGGRGPLRRGEAADGVAALAAAAELEPDLVLLNVQRPRRLPLVTGCGARGFIAKGDLTGAALARLFE